MSRELNCDVRNAEPLHSANQTRVDGTTIHCRPNAYRVDTDGIVLYLHPNRCPHCGRVFFFQTRDKMTPLVCGYEECPYCKKEIRNFRTERLCPDTTDR